jgi:deoxyribonucleoside regulator
MSTEPTDNRLSSSVRLPSDEQREHLMVRVAKLYYDLERTQSEIATELGLTRWQVGRLLTEAKELGVVRIEITPRAHRKTELEVQLQQEYGLRDAIVVPSGGTRDSALLMESVAQAAAKYLAGLNPKADLIGVSWGRTMSAVAKFLPGNWNPGVHVVLVNGSTNLRSTSARTSAVAEEFAQAGSGTATLLPVPAIVGKKSTRDALEEDPIIGRVLTLAEQADVVCFGMGGISHQSVLLNSGYLNEDDIDRLRDAGAVGDILGRFIDREGRIVDQSIDERTVGLRLESLTRKQRAIGVVSGEEKLDIAVAALKARYVSVLVTDEATARHALEVKHDT